MTNADPLSYTQLSTTQLQLSRVLRGRDFHFDININNRPLTITVATEELPKLPSRVLNLEIHGHPLRLFIGEQVLDYLLPENLDHNALTRLPEELTAAVLQHSLSPVLQALAEGFGVSALFQSLATIEPDLSLPCLGLNITSEAISTRIEVELNDLLISLLDTIPAHQIPQLPDIPFWTTLEMGSTQLPLSDLQELETGDIVFLEQHVKGQQVIVRLNQNTAFLGETTGTQVSILQRFQTMDEHHQEALPEDGMEHHDEVPGETGEASDIGVELNDLPVLLTFEVGQQQLTLNELQGMNVGFIFELDSPIQHPVSVRANGKLIGHCELVQIENRLGARITHLTDE